MSVGSSAATCSAEENVGTLAFGPLAADAFAEVERLLADLRGG
ncbi:MAG TPA: hypothetical protein VI011_14490 [Asanoa sp.]